MAAIEFDLTHFLKETQLQHGLRSEDYGRYHAYLSNRLATLRKQLHLANDRKKFLHREVTPANATDARHLMLLALYAERCWAEAESVLEKHQAQKSAARGEGNKPKGGVPPRDLCGKRLNKSVKWTEKLRAVAQAVGSPRLQRECEAYHNETSGRCATAHARFTEAKKHFAAARNGYYGLRSSSSDAQWAVVQLKINELDDRVVFCMQQLDEDPATYTPPVVGGDKAGDDAGELAGTSLKWNGRTLNVSSIKVKDALREARSVPVEAAQAKVLEAAGTVAVGQTNRVLDLMDRRINSFNDALAHARQDLRGAAEGSKAKVELQLIVHYFLFQVSQESLRRTLFLAEVYSRRFHATEKVVREREEPQQPQRRLTAKSAKKKSCVSPAQFASPLEVVRLYEAAADAVEQMELLPGVADREDVEEMAAAVRAGKLIYTGESWRVVGDTVRAEQCYHAAMAVLKDAHTMPEAKKLRELAEAASLQMAAENTLASSSSTASGAGKAAALAFLTEAAPGQVAVAQNVLRFPPDYQATACKPTFVDIASTYIEYPSAEEASVAGNAGTGSDAGSAHVRKQQQQQQQQQQAATASAKKGGDGSSGKSNEGGTDGKKWGWKWGWGS